MTKSHRSAATTILVAFLLTLVSYPTFAAAPAKKSEQKTTSVNVNYQAIIASKTPRTKSGEVYVDPRLGGLKNKLTGVFQYKSYELGDQANATLSTDKSSNVPLLGGAVTVSSKLESVDERGQPRISLKLLQGNTKVIETTIVPKGEPVILGGAKYKDGDLMVAVNVGK